MLATDGISIYYEWQDNNAGSDGEFMGLLFRNSSIKPSYTATKALSDALGMDLSQSWICYYRGYLVLN